jgi:hypothetical protein
MYDEEDRNHICCSKGFLVYENHFKSKLDEGSKLLLFSLWLDEYRKSLKSPVLFSLLVMRIDSSDTMEKVLLSIFPPNTDVQSALSSIVLPFARKLEEGMLYLFFTLTHFLGEFSCYFSYYERLTNFVGGLNYIVGDHISQCAISGVMEPNKRLADSPIDRYDLIDSCLWLFCLILMMDVSGHFFIS